MCQRHGNTRLASSLTPRRFLGLRWHQVPSDCSPIGSITQKTAPRGSFAVAQSRPPCASTIERQINNPMPEPFDLVVSKASKMRARFAGGSPGPESLTSTSTPCVYVFASEKAHLQLADVVPTFRERQRRVAIQITLEIIFTEHREPRRAVNPRRLRMRPSWPSIQPSIITKPTLQTKASPCCDAETGEPDLASLLHVLQ